MLNKYAWAIPLKNKDGSECEAIAKIIQKSKRCLKSIDIGKEFYNVDVQQLLKKYNINHYSTYSVMKASDIERFNHTLKKRYVKDVYI